MKTTEDQGEKHIKALETHGKQLVKYNNEKESLMQSKQKKNFKDLPMKEWKKYKMQVKKLILII